MRFAVFFAWLALVVAEDKWKFTWKEAARWNEAVKASLASQAKTQGIIRTDSSSGSNLIGGLPVYISLTTIANRLHLLSPTIQSIIAGSYVPTMIYIFVSPDPYLIDTGITEDDIMNADHNLVPLLEIFPNIKFVFTENIGPHRKVLPLLHRVKNEDVVIISVDDDHIYVHHWLRDMLAYYIHSRGESIISSRARRIAICSGQAPYQVAPYMHLVDPIAKTYSTQWYEAPSHTHEMLLLPTGVGGVLYRPRFFNLSIAFSKELWEVTPRGDDLTFRIATLARGIKVYTACILGDFKDKKKVTNCPDLNGVDFHFEKIARRLEVAISNKTVVSSGAGMKSVNDSVLKTNLRHNVLVKNGTSSDNFAANSKVGTNIGASRNPSTNTSVKVTNHTSTATTIASTTTTAAPHTPILVDIAPPKRNVDHGDKGSLSSINSKHDGNFHQWNKATHYLKESHLFDINAFIQPYVVFERTSCVVNPALLNYDKDGWLGSITGKVMENLQSLSESYRDDGNRCGIVSCKNPHP
eukprot:gene11778-13671_t